MNKILQFFLLSNSKQKDIELIMNPRFAPRNFSINMLYKGQCPNDLDICCQDHGLNNLKYILSDSRLSKSTKTKEVRKYLFSII